VCVRVVDVYVVPRNSQKKLKKENVLYHDMCNDVDIRTLIIMPLLTGSLPYTTI
jgi:hypothetical protein